MFGLRQFFQRDVNGTTLRVTHDHDQTSFEQAGCKFDAADLRRRDYITHHTNDKQITQALIENQLRRHSCVGTAKGHRKRRLLLE